jgi:hypothetical protein
MVSTFPMTARNGNNEAMPGAKPASQFNARWRDAVI